MTSYDQMVEMAATLSFSDKLRFNSEFAALLKKDAKAGSVGKAVKKEKKQKDPSAPKKETGVGQKAWFAFVKHCKATMPERFTDCTKEPERLTVCGLIKAEGDGEAYKTFVAQFKSDAASEAPSSSESEAETEAAPAAAPAAGLSKVEKIKAEMAAKKAAAEEKAAAAAAKKTAAAEKKAAKESKPKKEPKAKKSDAVAAVAEAESPPMPIKVIAGKSYYWDEDDNGLFAVAEDKSFGDWVGRFQPGNEAQPIRFTDSPSDE